MASKFFNYLKAGYPILWVETHEEDRAINQLRHEASMYDSFSWNIMSGLWNFQKPECDQIASSGMGDPMFPLETIKSLPETSVMFVKDFHKFLPGVEIYRAMKNLIPVLKATDKHIVVVSPVTNIPTEIEKDITIFDFGLPGIDDLMAIAKRMIIDNELNVEVDPQTIMAAKGLTLDEAENAMAYSIITKGGYDRGILEDAKLQTVKKSGVMELWLPEPEDQLGGLENLKSYLHNRKEGFTNPDLPTPRGILLTGLPGAGKSLAAKVTASIFGFPLLKLDIASLKGSLVGESQKKMRQATQLADAIGEAIIWCDEIEKSIGGVQSSNKTDGGTGSSMFGHLLTWMQETKSRVYILGTCNDMDELLSISQGALLRRFDDIFFVDVPTPDERKSILEIMNKRFKTEIDLSFTDRMINWTGAEIEKFVKGSCFDGIDVAFNSIHPIYEQNKIAIQKAKDWAQVNTRMANSSAGVHESTIKVRRLKVS